MKKKKEKLNKNLIIFLAIAVTVVGSILYFRGSQNITSVPSIKTEKQTKTYRSKDLKFTITVPSNFGVEERFTMVNLKKVGGNISIDRIGTNFDNLEDYLQDLATKNKILIINKNKHTIASLNTISSIARHPVSKRPDEKVYFIYVDNWVYSLSASSEALFSDLDTIAQSFHYTP